LEAILVSPLLLGLWINLINGTSERSVGLSGWRTLNSKPVTIVEVNHVLSFGNLANACIIYLDLGDLLITERNATRNPVRDMAS
jgi:hypothetical protein